MSDVVEGVHISSHRGIGEHEVSEIGYTSIACACGWSWTGNVGHAGSPTAMTTLYERFGKHCVENLRAAAIHARNLAAANAVPKTDNQYTPKAANKPTEGKEPA